MPTPSPVSLARGSAPTDFLALLLAADQPIFYSLVINNAHLPSVPPRRVPLRARNVPTTSGQLRTGLLLRPRRPAERWPRPRRSQCGSRCVLRPAVLVLARGGAAGRWGEGGRGEMIGWGKIGGGKIGGANHSPRILTPTPHPNPSPSLIPCGGWRDRRLHTAQHRNPSCWPPNP